MVYAREVQDQTLTFGVSGKLIMNALVMYDRETESLWSQFLGEAVEGPLLGERLTLIPSRLTTWGEWKAEHPDTLALDTGSRPYDSYLDYYASSRTGIMPETNPDDRLRPKQLVLGLIGERTQRAYAHADLKTAQVVNDVFEDASIVVMHDAASRSVGAFSRIVDGATLTFAQAGDPGQMTDAETGSTWSKLTGQAIAGEHEGARLSAYPAAFNAFWFGWSDYYPNTEVWK